MNEKLKTELLSTARLIECIFLLPPRPRTELITDEEIVCAQTVVDKLRTIAVKGFTT